MPAKRNVNLLPKDEFKFSVTGKFIKWAISVGRWIVVLTEFVVICAFLSRFYFDTVLDNLFDETRQKQAIVDSAQSFEENFQEIQEKTKMVKTLLAKEKKPSLLFTEVNQVIPANVFLTSVSIADENLQLAGYSLSEKSLSLFVSGLKTLPNLEKISLSNVALKEEEAIGIAFDISAKIKKQ